MLYSTDQVGEAVGVSALTIRRWIAKGVAKPATTSGHHKFTLEEMNRLKDLYFEYVRIHELMGDRRVIG